MAEIKCDTSVETREIINTEVTLKKSSLDEKKWNPNQVNCVGREPMGVLKKAVTPIHAKPNLLKLLKKHNNDRNENEVFKTIGNRIFIPMKYSSSAKKTEETKLLKVIIPGSAFQVTNPKVVTHGAKFSVSASSRFSKFGISTLLTQKSSADVQQKEFNKIAIASSPVNSIEDYGDLKSFVPLIPPGLGSLTLNTDKSKPLLSDDQMEDNDLTSLSWLSENNMKLRKMIRMCNPDDPGIGLSGDETDNDENLDRNKSIFTATSPIDDKKNNHKTTDEYKYNRMSKPPYSFSSLIFMAIEDSYLKRLPVKEIYDWVCRYFPYYRTAQSGWKNSIRHNLSLNKSFKKAESRKDMAKGSLWCIDQAYKQNLVQQLERAPFYPFFRPNVKVGQPSPLNSLAYLLPGAFNDRVPSLGSTMPPNAKLWADPDMASAAYNLMGLSHNDVSFKEGGIGANNMEERWRADVIAKFCGKRERSPSIESVGNEQLVISGASQDHLYTKNSKSQLKKKPKRDNARPNTPDSEKSAPDAAYEFETFEFSENDMEKDALGRISGDNDVDSDREEQQHLFDSGFGGMLRHEFQVSRKKNTTNNLKKDAKPSRKRKKSMKEYETKSCKSAKPQPSTSSLVCKLRKSTRQVKLSARAKLAAENISAKKRKNVKNEKKEGGVDSVEDLPKVDRSKGRRLKQPNLKASNNFNYHTRSSKHTLLGQESEEKKKRSLGNTKQKYLISDEEGANEVDDVMWAAGNLLRLYWSKSPVTSRKV